MNWNLSVDFDVRTAHYIYLFNDAWPFLQFAETSEKRSPCVSTKRLFEQMFGWYRIYNVLNIFQGKYFFVFHLFHAQ